MKMNIYAPLFSSICFFLSTLAIQAQNPTIQDCLGATPVCQSLYSESQSPVGTGNIANEINTSISCTAGEINSIWYVFTANSDGQLGFLITPNDLNDDYDWALFNMTNANCNDIGTDQSIVESCNAAGGTGCHGATGCTASGIGNNTPGGCGGSGPFNQLVNMQEGETYVLMVSNWTGSPSGYTLDFSESTGVGIFDETAPEVESITNLPESCDDQTIDITFNEFLQCNSVNNADFQLAGPGGPYTLSVASVECNQGSEKSRDYTLTINPPIASMGDFILSIAPTSGTELLDLCDNQLLPTTFNFTVDVPLTFTPNIGQDTSLVCAGDELILDASAAGIGWLWEDGSMESTLAVTQAGIYSVTVTSVCAIGMDEVEVFVQTVPPAVDFGNDMILCEGENVLLNADNGLAFYEWQDSSTGTSYNVTTDGDYSVTVTNGCGVDQDEIALAFVPPLNLNLATNYVLCLGDTLKLDIDRPYATYQWSDGYTQNNGSYREIMADGSFSVTVTTQCEVYSQDFTVFFLEDPTLDLGLDTMLCPNEILRLNPGIPGAYTWQDGSTADTFLIDVPGLYEVNIETVCNILEGDIFVDYFLPVETNIGRDTFLCLDESLLLDATTAVQAEYFWEDGSKGPTRKVTGPGLYLSTVISPCETFLDTLVVVECEICHVFVPNVFTPNLDGVNDKIAPFGGCDFETYQFNIYDRWGAQVFASGTPGQGWDGRVNGKMVPQGTYVWQFEYIVIENGYPRSEVQVGDVVVLR